MNNKIYFTETQRFRQKWLWMLLIGINVLIVAIIWIVLINDPKSEELTVPGAIIVTCIGPAITIITLIIPRLNTNITEEEIQIKFFPFHLSYRKYKWNDISSAYVRKYSPLGEYGGWGIRFGFGNGKAFNVSGNMGLQLEFNTGRKLLIGTNKPEELERSLQELGKRKIHNSNT